MGCLAFACNVPPLKFKYEVPPHLSTPGTRTTLPLRFRTADELPDPPTTMFIAVSKIPEPETVTSPRPCSATK